MSVTRHRFINDGRKVIPMGSTAEYTCVCGRRGTYEAIDRHITEQNLPGSASASETTPTAPYAQVAESDGFGGGTVAHYLPNEPRKPAATEELLPLQRPTPDPLPPPPSAPSVVDASPCPIAELFQTMLRSAFQAGAVSTTTGEAFETWYQREVLR